MSGATPDPPEPPARARCRRAAAADAGPAAGQICDRLGARLAASGAAFERHRPVSGGVLGRPVAGAAVRRARHRHRPVRAAGARGAVSAGSFSLADPRGGAEPARPRHRHPPSPGDRADRYAGDPGSGGAGAVAGAARAHAGLDQAHPRRPAVAAAGDPRPLGAARAGRGDDGRDLCRRRRRAHDARRRGLRLERRAGAGQCPGRCLGDAADLYRQAADHPVGRQQGRRLRPTAGRCRFRPAARCWCAPAAAPSMSWSAAA